MTGLNIEATKSALPESIKELLQIISADGVAALVEHFGGTRICLSKESVNAGTLEKILNEPDINALRYCYGGLYLTIPSCYLSRRMSAWLSMADDKKNGLSIAAIARKHQVSTRAVWLALRRLDDMGMLNNPNCDQRT